jgi:membrane-bound ClpP family serine protease
MMRPRWTARALWRYALFQIPDLCLLFLVLIVVRRWLDLPNWFTFGLILFWLTKDIVVFPFVWRAYDHPRVRSMIGVKGFAEERLAPSGHVRVHGELWQAEVIGKTMRVEKGEAVRVREIDGLRLLVEPEAEEKTK